MPPPTGSGDSPPPQATSLSCAGYPQPSIVFINGSTRTYTKVCLLVQEYAPVTPALSVSTQAGNLLAHGGATSNTYVVYSRIIALAADQGSATALAKSVVISTANSTIVASPDHVDNPQGLQIDFELFTDPTTNLTLRSAAGNIAADNYNATFHGLVAAGDTSLQNVQGQVNLETDAGSIKINVTGADWSGSGMMVSTQTGIITLSHPVGYQASFTAQSELGTASVDGKSATTMVQGTPATVTAGSGAPIALKTAVGDVSVTVTQ